PFAEAAARFSTDKNSRNNGGIVINPNTLSSKFSVEELQGNVSKTLSAMKINEISDPFEIVDTESRQSAFTIVKLINKVETHKANLQNDYQFLADIFLDKKREKVLKNWISDKQSQTYIRIDNSYANCNFEFSDWIK
ncbi:MAG: peptidylprolyl isomerase, partial [Mariniphaga sp.]